MELAFQFSIFLVVTMNMNWMFDIKDMFGMRKM